MRKKINNSIYAIAHSYFSLTNVIDKTYIMDLYVEFLEQGTQKEVAIDILEEKTYTILDEDKKVRESLKCLKEYLNVQLASIGYPKQNIKKAIIRIFKLEDNSKNVEITLQDVENRVYSKLLTTKNLVFLKWMLKNPIDNLKNWYCQGSHLVIFQNFLNELRGTGGYINKSIMKLHYEKNSK